MDFLILSVEVRTIAIKSLRRSLQYLKINYKESNLSNQTYKMYLPLRREFLIVVE